MNLRIASRIAARELRGGLRGFRVFLACLAMGVAAIAAVGSVRESITTGLSAEGATILGGDAEIQLTYRFATADERAAFDAMASPVSEIVDFRSMAVTGTGQEADRALTQIKAVDAAYPILGSVQLSPDMPLDQALAGAGGLPGAVMDPVLMDRLSLEPGDKFALGTQQFHLSAALVREPDSAVSGFGLGPRTIVRTTDLAASGLLQPGTLFETAYRMQLPPGTDPDVARQQAETVLDGTGFRWRDARDGAPGVREFVERLGAFLVIVGLAGLAVGGVGVSAAVRAYLDEKTAVIATLKSLGATGGTIFAVYFMQIGALTLLGTTIGLILGAAAPLALQPLIEARLPVPAQIGVYPSALAEAALYGLLAALLFTTWPLAQAQRIRAAALFRDASLGMRGWPRWPYVLATGALLAMLVATAAWLTGVPSLAIWAAVGLSGAFVTLWLAGIAMRFAARRLSHARLLRGRTTLRNALGAVGGPGGESSSVVLSLGLGLSVLAAVGQIDANLRGAIQRDLPDVAPSYFVVDIQNDQLDPFLARLATHESITRIEHAPMLRGVITQINNRPATEVAGDHWVLQGDRGLTYAAAPPSGTKVTEGDWWPADYAGDPQISISDAEAREMGLALGDALTINILGRDITGTITSFREVDFSNAGMGFVLSMNPAALSGAPHSHIATIYADTASEGAILRDIATAFPNITAIRVRDGIQRVSEVLSGIAAATTFGAMATLLTGVIVLIGAAAAGERSRTYEAAVLKTLGATRGAVLRNFALRSVLLGAAAGLVAIFAGGVAGWAVMTHVMDTTFHFEPWSAIAIVLGGVLVTLLAGLWFAWRSLSAKPAQVLRARE